MFKPNIRILVYIDKRAGEKIYGIILASNI